jgi:hypothetical protein
VLGLLLALVLPAGSAKAFALLGPYADWMDITNSYRAGWDVGGPMDIGEEYRWNVPVVTYGFDPSFIEYFGTDGIDAVEQAVQILNDLTAASLIDLTDFTTFPVHANRTAIAGNGCDLKSLTLALILEQMGLTQPTRSVFVLRLWDPVFLSFEEEWEWPSGTIPNNVVERNFDPETLASSHSVNGNWYTGDVISWGPPSNPLTGVCAGVPG